MKKIIILSLAIIITLTLAGCQCNKEDNTNQASVNLNNINSSYNENIDQDAEFTYETDEETQERIDNMSETGKAAAMARDESRIADIKSIQVALELFNTEKGNYPETADELVSAGYLTGWPQDPKEGEAEEYTYTYTPIGKIPAQYYDLSYYLEVGVSNISTGLHVANPDGLANP